MSQIYNCRTSECQFQGKMTRKALYLEWGIWNSKMQPTGSFLSFLLRSSKIRPVQGLPMKMATTKRSQVQSILVEKAVEAKFHNRFATRHRDPYTMTYSKPILRMVWKSELTFSWPMTWLLIKQTCGHNV